MSKRKYVYADSYGLVYRFSPRKWKQMLQQLAAGHEVHYGYYGEVVCTVHHNITDLDREQAQGLLDEIQREQEAERQLELADSKRNKVLITT